MEKVYSSTIKLSHLAIIQQWRGLMKWNGLILCLYISESLPVVSFLYLCYPIKRGTSVAGKYSADVRIK